MNLFEHMLIGQKPFLCIYVFVFVNHSSQSGEKNPKVKHYQIRQTETGAGQFYLAENYLFNTIPELIHYHQHNAAGKVPFLFTWGRKNTKLNKLFQMLSLKMYVGFLPAWKVW